MTLKSNAKFEEELTCRFNSEFDEFRALESLKNFHFNRLLLSKVYIV